MSGRKANGAGSLYWNEQRERYQARIMVGGQRQTRNFSALQYGGQRKAERAARDWLADINVDYRRGDYHRPVRLTLAKAGELFLERDKRGSERYRHQNEQRLHRFLDAHPAVPVQDAGELLYTFFATLATEVGPKTFRHYRYTIRRFAKHAGKRGWINHDRWVDWDLIPNPEVQRRQYNLYLDGLVDLRPRLVEVALAHGARCGSRHVPGAEAAALVSLMGNDGLSPGEVLGVAWPDLDSACNLLRVTRTVHAVARSGYAGGGAPLPSSAVGLKRGSRARTLVLSEPSQDALRRLQRGQGLVFGNASGGPERVQHLDALTTRLCRMAGITPRNPGELRHTAITLALAYSLTASTATYQTVSLWAGHASVTTTTTNYLHMLPRGHGSEAVIKALAELNRAPIEMTMDG